MGSGVFGQSQTAYQMILIYDFYLFDAIHFFLFSFSCNALLVQHIVESLILLLCKKGVKLRKCA